MRFATIHHDGRLAFGAVDGDHLIDVSASFRSPAEALSLGDDSRLACTDVTGQRIPLAGAVFAPPVPQPQRILCIGVNYAAHRAESDRPSDSPYPTVFVRFPSSVVGHGEPIVRPHVSDRFDWEGEMAVVIGRTGRYIKPADALTHVAGYTCFNDGTIRDYQRHTTQFTPGKTFDRSGACGPWVVTADEIPDPSALHLRTLVNGAEMQSAPTSHLIHDVPALIAYCSQFTALEPGDLIVTGTPGGVGYARTPPVFLAPGDVVEVEISGIGTLRNEVVDEAS
jgi:2-keto-4-pentenoate hydratase/2-oxohepta-3-ene-1,7-dioic acid hydratase in catechol pathway